MICHYSGFLVLPYDKHWGYLHAREHLIYFLRPSSEGLFSIPKCTQSIQIGIIHGIVFGYFFNFDLPFSITQRPDTFSQASQRGLNQRRVRMIDEERFKLISIKRSLE